MGSCVGKDKKQPRNVPIKKISDSDKAMLVANTNFNPSEIDEWHEGFMVTLFFTSFWSTNIS
jgi:hypothetical protein